MAGKARDCFTNNMRYKIADVETTGLSPDAKVVEVAWMEVDENLEVLDQHSSLINPGIPIEPGASAVNGIYDRDVVNAPTIEEFYAERWNPEEPTVIAAHNAQFDLRYLGGFYDNLQGSICTLALARKTVKGLPNYRLGTLRDFFGIEAGPAHRALTDVDVTRQVLRQLLARSGADLPTTLERMRRPYLLHTMPFGRFRGRSFLEIPASYREWALGLPDLPPEIRYSFEHAEKAKR